MKQNNNDFDTISFLKSSELNTSAPFAHLLRVQTLQDPKGLWWVAEYINLPGVVGTSRTRQGAIEDLLKNVKPHLEMSLFLGLDVPEELVEFFLNKK